jgi:hypothetical protein
MTFTKSTWKGLLIIEIIILLIWIVPIRLILWGFWMSLWSMSDKIIISENLINPMYYLINWLPIIFGVLAIIGIIKYLKHTATSKIWKSFIIISTFIYFFASLVIILIFIFLIQSNKKSQDLNSNYQQKEQSVSRISCNENRECHVEEMTLDDSINGK